MNHVPHHERREREFLTWLTRRISDYARREVGQEALLVECGLDSVALLSLYGDIEAEFGSLIDPEDMWVYPTVRELAGQLAVRRARVSRRDRVRVVFVFVGQGCQYPGMAEGLYRHSASYRISLTWVDEVLRPYLGRSVTELILSQDPGIDRTSLSQPALFAVEYALARTLLDAGVRPVAVLGHGLGEFAAATVAEALTPGHAARLVALRGAFMQRLPDSGGMLATCADPYEAAEVAASEPGCPSAPSTRPGPPCSPAISKVWRGSATDWRTPVSPAGFSRSGTLSTRRAWRRWSPGSRRRHGASPTPGRASPSTRRCTDGSWRSRSAPRTGPGRSPHLSGSPRRSGG